MRNFRISFSCFSIHFKLKVKHALVRSLFPSLFSPCLPSSISLSVSFTLPLCVLQLDFVFVVNKFIKRIPFAPFVLHKIHNGRESAKRKSERERWREKERERKESTSAGWRCKFPSGWPHETHLPVRNYSQAPSYADSMRLQDTLALGLPKISYRLYIWHIIETLSSLQVAYLMLLPPFTGYGKRQRAFLSLWPKDFKDNKPMHFACHDTRGTSLFDCECCITTTTTPSKTMTTTRGKQQSCHMLTSATRPNIMQAFLTFPSTPVSLCAPYPFATSFPIENFVVTATGKTVFHFFIFTFFFAALEKLWNIKMATAVITHTKRGVERRGGG